MNNIEVIHLQAACSHHSCCVFLLPLALRGTWLNGSQSLIYNPLSAHVWPDFTSLWAFLLWPSIACKDSQAPATQLHPRPSPVSYVFINAFPGGSALSSVVRVIPWL